MGTGGESFHPNPKIMARTALTAELADAALKPFGLRVTAWSSTKFLVWKGDQNQCKRREAVAELIEVYQSAA
jgi:hypothetical protein